MANLLVSDCENPLSALILLGKGFELLDRFGLGNREKELDVLARIFMSTLVKMYKLQVPAYAMFVEASCLHRLWCHLGETQVSRSGLCASLPRYPRRIFHIL
jgi:hypothetical protein